MTTKNSPAKSKGAKPGKKGSHALSLAAGEFPPGFDKYSHYEESVQAPDFDVDSVFDIYRELKLRDPISLREDFCGTFQVCCSWVKKGEKQTAVGLDLDPEPIQYGMRHHLSELSASQQKRVDIREENVLNVTQPGVDVVMACNFSYFIFQKRQELLQYFEKVHASLGNDGLFFMDIAGGPGFIEEIREKKKIESDRTGKFKYIWNQKSYNPITANGHYSIDFKLKDGTLLEDCFTYDWRVWTIPEVRDIVTEAGFSKTVVYWDVEDQDDEEDDYIQTEDGVNDHAYVAYVVGVK